MFDVGSLGMQEEIGTLQENKVHSMKSNVYVGRYVGRSHID